MPEIKGVTVRVNFNISRWTISFDPRLVNQGVYFLLINHPIPKFCSRTPKMQRLVKSYNQAMENSR
jgi:hypothetical protein